MRESTGVASCRDTAASGRVAWETCSFTNALAGLRGDVLALACGALFPLGFAPFDVAAAVYPLLATFFVLCTNVSARRAAWRGWLFGIALFTIGGGWVHMALHYGSTATISASVVAAAIIGYLAIYMALSAWSASVLSGGRVGIMLLVFPFTWVAAEYLRSIGQAGVPWLLTGYSQIDTPVGGYAPVIGVYGVGLVVATLSALLSLVVLRKARVMVGAMAMLIVVAVGWQLSKVSWTYPVGEPLRVALLQGKVVQDEKWSNHTRTRMNEWYLEMTGESWNHDLIVWPETAMADSASNIEKQLASLRLYSVRDNKDVFIGMPMGDVAKGDYFNSIVNLQGGTYHKRHLIPFAERFPLSGWTRWLAESLGIPIADIRKGEDQQPLLEVAGHPAGTTICFELAFSNEVRRALPVARLLVNSSDDGAFHDTVEPHQHHQIARFRALESGRFLARAANAGISAVIGPHGEVIASAPAGSETVVSARIQPMVGATPYVMFGDGALLFLTAMAFAAAAILRPLESSAA